MRFSRTLTNLAKRRVCGGDPLIKETPWCANTSGAVFFPAALACTVNTIGTNSLHFTNKHTSFLSFTWNRKRSRVPIWGIFKRLPNWTLLKSFITEGRQKSIDDDLTSLCVRASSKAHGLHYVVNANTHLVSKRTKGGCADDEANEDIRNCDSAALKQIRLHPNTTKKSMQRTALLKVR